MSEQDIVNLRRDNAQLRVALLKMKSDLAEKDREIKGRDEAIEKLLLCREGETADELRRLKIVGLDLEAKKRRIDILKIIEEDLS